MNISPLLYWLLSHWLCIYPTCKIPSERKHLCWCSEQLPGRVLDRAQVSFGTLKVGRAHPLSPKEFWWCPAGSQTPGWAVGRRCVWEMAGRIGKEEEKEAALCCHHPVLEDWTGTSRMPTCAEAGDMWGKDNRWQQAERITVVSKGWAVSTQNVSLVTIEKQVYSLTNGGLAQNGDFLGSLADLLTELCYFWAVLSCFAWSFCDNCSVGRSSHEKFVWHKVAGKLPGRLELPFSQMSLFKSRWFKENCHWNSYS